jgi:signal transduction histidine kinase
MGEKIEHLNRIVERTLDLARHTEPKLAAVDLNRLIDDLGLLIRHKLTQQRVRLVRRLDPALPSLQADATQLEQAFLNLALNAVEAMPEGGQLTVATRSWPPATRGAAPTHVVAVFRDTGHGMTPEQKRRAFSSLLDSTKAKGAGLGLALVARVVDAHHGKLQVASQPGRGTTFTLLLPIEPEPALGMKRSGARPPP